MKHPPRNIKSTNEREDSDRHFQAPSKPGTSASDLGFSNTTPDTKIQKRESSRSKS